MSSFPSMKVAEASHSSMIVSSSSAYPHAPSHPGVSNVYCPAVTIGMRVTPKSPGGKVPYSEPPTYSRPASPIASFGSRSRGTPIVERAARVPPVAVQYVRPIRAHVHREAGEPRAQGRDREARLAREHQRRDAGHVGRGHRSPLVERVPGLVELEVPHGG